MIVFTESTALLWQIENGCLGHGGILLNKAEPLVRKFAAQVALQEARWWEQHTSAEERLLRILELDGLTK